MTSVAYAALWLFVFTVPWENVVVITGVGALSRLMGMVAMGFMLLAAAAGGRFRRWHALHVSALLFLAWAAVGLLMYGSVERLSYKFQTYVQLFLMVWMIWELAPSRKRLVGLLAAYVAGAYVGAMRLGALVPVGDAAALADAIVDALARPRERVAPEVLEPFTRGAAVDHYLPVIEGLQ